MLYFKTLLILFLFLSFKRNKNTDIGVLTLAVQCPNRASPKVSAPPLFNPAKFGAGVIEISYYLNLISTSIYVNLSYSP